MTKFSPRIYTYKITFEEVPYYYYGVHKEKNFDEYYMGSPVTHKWCWELYTPKKQILELFDYTDEGWIEAQEVEKKLIKPFYQTDKWCLNENCMGIYSLRHASKAGKIGGKVGGEKARKLKLGFHAYTTKERKEVGRKTYEQGKGCFSLTPEERSEVTRKVNNQRWECCETGYVSTASGVVQYQKGKRIDTSKNNRRRIS